LKKGTTLPKRSKGRKKIIGCFYGSVPKELVHSAGMVPVQLVEDRNYQYEARTPALPLQDDVNLTGQIYDKVFDYVDAVWYPPSAIPTATFPTSGKEQGVPQNLDCAEHD
jgi:hypothetical protein